MDAPIAEKKPHNLVIHGDTRVDDYYWLREKDTKPVLDYLNAENQYAQSVMDDHKVFQQKLFKELKSRIPQTDMSVPAQHRDGYWYYTRTVDGQQYSIHCRSKTLYGDEEVILDVNEFKDQEFVSVGGMSIPRNTTMVWYLTDFTGFTQYQLRARNFARGEDIEFKALTANPEFGRVTSYVIVEGRDDAMFLTVEDEKTKRSDKLYFWRVGDDAPTLLFEETDERFNIGLTKSGDHKYILLISESHTTTETWYWDATKMKAAPVLFAPRIEDQEYYVDHHKDGYWFIRVNDTGRNFRIATAWGDMTDREEWEEVRAHDPNTLLEGFDTYDDALVANVRIDGVTGIQIGKFDLNPDKPTISNWRQVQLPEFPSEVELGSNPLPSANKVRIVYESLTRAATTADVNFDTLELNELKRDKVMGPYDPDDYVSERIFATAEDGTKIPISIARRKDTPLDGTAPVQMMGYGAYGLSYEIYFSHLMLTMMDRGFIYVITHIRGGSEMGTHWHDDGRMENKINSFTDFIACAEHLIAEKYTSADRLCIEGRSAGGLLISGVVNMRPDLFRAAIVGVPFTDVLTTMLDPDIPLTVGEFEEWGDPKVPEHYERMKVYSPYDNIEAKDYPSLLVRTSYNDSAVMYWEPAKYVAKLRAHKTDENPLLFLCDMGAGHGGSSGRYDAYRDLALDIAFMCTQVGIAE